MRVNAICVHGGGHSGCPDEVVCFLASPWTSANGAVWSLEAAQLVP